MKESVTALVGGRALTIENGKVAKQADGSAVVRLGDTMVLVTACYARDPKDVDFVPLTVEYKEYQYAAGRIPGGFFKREGRPTEKEILTCRMIDRPIRPLFPAGYAFETQVVALVLSADGENDPDVLAINGTAAALAVNPIPFTEILGAVRVGRIGDRFVFNPTKKEREESVMDLVVVGTRKAVSMVEAGAKECSEELMLEAILEGHRELQKVIDAIEELQRRQGVVKQAFTPPAPVPAEVMAEVRRNWDGPMMEALTWKGKIESYAKIKEVKKAAVSVVPDDQPEKKAQVKRAVSELVEVMTRETILRDRKRLDGRAFDEVRPIEVEIGVLPRTHGSALFTRGETQALVTVTLGTSDDTQLIEDLEGEFEKKFLLHYNFPPFSVGEAGRFIGPGRREIGHGALAERSLVPVLPPEDVFPYSIRVVSEIMASNGSTSMASICGGCLALMDAGVPIIAPVAGISCGLMTENGPDGSITKWTTITDILGEEDHFGDMDFKLAGTTKGITGFQLDLKIKGLPFEIAKTAIFQARDARIEILKTMLASLPAPRKDLSQYAPRIQTIQIDPEKIGLLIGPGGKTIRRITETTGAQIDIAEDDSGKVFIYSNNADAMNRAVQEIDALCGGGAQIEIGKIYTGRVTGTKEFGAFVECLPGKEGLVHISELADFRVRRTEDVVKVGDSITVKCVGIDERSGKVRLSRKAAMKDLEAQKPQAEAAPAGEAPAAPEAPAQS